MDTILSDKYKRAFADFFPGDHSGDLRPRQTPGMLYSKAIPTPVREPKLLAWSNDLAAELGIRRPENKEEIALLAGNHLVPSMYPYAACYAGHQFGHWAGQLGDGRAITLGEWPVKNGASWEFQLKGAGPTPYSRRADGRAVLRSSLREYLMSEAMHYLGVPTTRALSLVSTGDEVMRDMFYDGNAAYEPGAIVMRVAPSFLRFGNFQMLAAREETEELKKLCEWTIERYYPHIKGEDKLLQWFAEIVERTAALMVEWLRVGFVHGVMNTDNMSILGLTIDYGPFSFLDDYDHHFTPNTTDLPGRRYAFGKQPAIAHWNLACLAGALAPLLEDTDALGVLLDGYKDVYAERYHAMMADKLGFDKAGSEDHELILEFEKTLNFIKPDMTIFYQLLATLPTEILTEEEAIAAHFSESFYRLPDAESLAMLTRLIGLYLGRLKRNTCSREASLNKMKAANPRFILRNYLLHQAIEELQQGDESLFLRLQEAIREPYSDKFDEFLIKRPDWAGNKAGCSMLSCSS